MEVARIAYRSTGRFSPLVLDHLEGDGFLDGFRQHRPTWQGLQEAAAAKAFSAESREALVQALHRQYAGLPIDGPVADSIGRLARPDALTITTGHQLCLFLGPLYVLFKVLNAIRLAEDAQARLGRPVVPVFWMATEDHDRAEIDHAWFGERKLQWPGDPGGAVGRMRLAGIGPVVEEACAALGTAGEAQRIGELIRACYRPERTLADATRRFAHALFGRYGLVAVDGDDPALKRLFAPIMRQELLEGIGWEAVQQADRMMSGRYPPQAHARAVNLFRLGDGQRARIERDGDGFRMLPHGLRFGREELLADLEAHPERYSPNVILRPVYQEAVLPNIACIGGGGELAYWMQLRPLFEAVGIAMPAVLLRTSAASLTAKADRHRAALGLSLEDLFQPAPSLRTRVARAAAGLEAGLADELARLEGLIASAQARATAIDSTLTASAGAAHARMRRALEGLQARMDRALRRREATAIARLDRILAELFPAGALRERRLGMAWWLAQGSPGRMEACLRALDPLDGRFTVFIGD